MTAATLTLTEFLLERIAEDEAVARGATQRGGWTVGFSPRHVATKQDDVLGEMRASEDAAHIVRHDPARVLAQCAAHRAIVDGHDSWLASETGRHCSCADGESCWPLRTLAAIYRGAPGWREEWAQ